MGHDDKSRVDTCSFFLLLKLVIGAVSAVIFNVYYALSCCGTSTLLLHVDVAILILTEEKASLAPTFHSRHHRAAHNTAWTPQIPTSISIQLVWLPGRSQLLGRPRRGDL